MNRFFAVLTAAAVALPAILSTPARSQPAEKQVTLAVLAPSALLWVHAIAEQAGFYKARNLQVRELRASDSPALLQAVSTGSVNAGASLGDLAVRAIDKGAPIVVAGAMLGKAILRLYAAKDVAGPGELAGKKVTAGAVRGGTANLMKFQLKKLGVDPAGLQLVSIANSRDRIVAMGNGQVSAALLIAPFDTLAEREGAKLLDVYREPYVETPLILNKAWAEQNRESATALTGAMKQAAAWINDPANKEAAIDILAKYTGTARDICAASYAFIIGEQGAIPPDFAVTRAGLENMYVIDADVGGEPATQAFSLERYYDASYLR